MSIVVFHGWQPETMAEARPSRGNMSGFDNDFALADGVQWIIHRFVRSLRKRWPRLVCGIDLDVYSEGGQGLKEYPRHVTISATVEMQHRTYREGLVSDANGEGSVGALLIPLLNGLTDVDIITCEPRPNAFTEFVIQCFCDAIFRRHQITNLALLRSRGALQRGVYSALVPADSTWLSHAVRACIDERWPEARISHQEGSDDAQAASRKWETVVTARRASDGIESIIFFCETAVGAPGTLIGVRGLDRVSRTFAAEARALLREAATMWHIISYRDMRARIIFTCPPGLPVFKSGVAEFEGSGGACPEPRKRLRD
ncbi:hypothetical protein [Corallococcus sp. 4LFB]|uniref:hypothetical protein n=1 Tax=Corallococcus sp. 4LFB TaxID=3383249 RepID=UPI003976B410